MVKVGDDHLLTTSLLKLNDEIKTNGQTYRVTQAEALPLENGIVVYECNLRSA